MSVDALADRFRDELGERVLDTHSAYDQLTVTVDPEVLPQVARFCKEDLGMRFFDFLSAVDEREQGYSVVARVYNHVKREGVVLKAIVPGGREEPRISTISNVYAGANWHERETYDMFGIIFEGHPGLLPRILTVENFEGWPLRKEFKLASRVVKPWPGAKEPADSDDDGAKAKPEASATPGADPGDRAAAAKAKAERAKAKAAAARKRKAEEKAAAQADENPAGSEEAVLASSSGDGAAAQADENPAGSEEAVLASSSGDGAAAQADENPAGSDDAEAGSPREAAVAAAGDDTPAHTPDPTTPEGASKIADTAVAKDAAAGTSVGDDVATGEQADSGEPKRDPDAEAKAAAGGPAESGGTPGVEAEGVHDLEESSARPGDADDADDDASGHAADDANEARQVPAVDNTGPDSSPRETSEETDQ